jgi:histidinol-phosphate phosphatase family protein
VELSKSHQISKVVFSSVVAVSRYFTNYVMEVEGSMSKIAAFIDFQGTLGGSGLDNANTLEFYPFSIEAIKKLNDSGVLVIGTTNQSGIEKGEFTWEEYLEAEDRLKAELAAHGAFFDAVYCCPHRYVECSCKKPKRGMVDMALKEFDIDLRNSFVVGDMGMSDMVLAKNIGSKAVLVLTGVGVGSLNEFRDTWKDVEPDHIAENVAGAADYIISTIHSLNLRVDSDGKA